MGRFIWSALFDNIRFMAGRGYNTFCGAQYNSKYVMVLAAPIYMSFARYRTETTLGYSVMITDKDDNPDTYPPNWKNGKKVYLSDHARVGDVKKTVFQNSDVPISPRLRVGCRGRAMRDDDNLGNAVRCFCRRDPRLVMWTED
eukprot:Selendium_serpulae@DN466_c1_g1_i1.p2